MTRARPTRRTARENAMQMLYQSELNLNLDRDAVKAYFREQMRHKELEAFALGLFDGVREQLASVDARLEQVSENWRLGRMAAVDRAILRLAAFELCHSDCPPKVAINEAIEISKRFSAADSPAYVNGVLDKILRQLQSPAPDESTNSSAEPGADSTESTAATDGVPPALSATPPPPDDLPPAPTAPDC